MGSLVLALPLLISPLFYFAFWDWVMLILFVVGVVLAVALMWFDQTVGYRYYAEPEKPVQLITRSPLFIVVYIPMTIFVVTSSGSALGTGLVLGIGTILWAELWWWRHYSEVLNGRFYAQAQKKLAPNDFTLITRGLLVFLVLMSVMVFF
jgi:hypothetical protein